MNTLEIAAIGLQQDVERLRVTSHNVANVTTPGYKRQVALQAAFSDVLDAQMSAQQAPSVHSDLSAGKLRATGNPLDVALADREFLGVATANGASALMRGGALQVDARGRLVTSGGLAVQGVNGDITVPTTAGSVRIDAAGQVFADDKSVGSLRVFKLKPGAALSALGDGLFAVSDVADAQPVASPAIQTGHTEASNVVSSQEMVQLMSTTRHAESMVRLMQGADEMLEKTIRKLGEM
jgi:flagellar basal body rod protein FlgG